MALKGLKVLEFAGLAPLPFCGMILADFGASVTRIDRSPENPLDPLQAGKRTLALNMKDSRAKELVHKMCLKYDVIMEGYRPGVMERLGLGPDVLLKENPALIYARLSGFGQTGPLKNQAGHDINYIAMSGVLSMLGRKGDKPLPPINLVADFAGGGLLCAFGILAALSHRNSTGEGQVVDCSMTEGAAYVASWLMRSRSMPIWPGDRGESLLDGGSFFYDTYETKDGQFVSVGCLEPQFFAVMVEKLGLNANEFTQYMDNAEGKSILEEIFKTKSQSEWSEIFENTDACVYPVIDWKRAPEHRLHKERGNFVVDGDSVVPQPAPKLSKSGSQSAVQRQQGDPYTNMMDVLNEVGVNKEEVQRLIDEQVVITTGKFKL